MCSGKSLGRTNRIVPTSPSLILPLRLQTAVNCQSNRETVTVANETSTQQYITEFVRDVSEKTLQPIKHLPPVTRQKMSMATHRSP